MEWVEVTAKTVEDAKREALDRLGVDGDDAEFEVVQQPSKGLFGLMRGEARVRARVRPTAVRPKRDRRDRGARREREATTTREPATDDATTAGDEDSAPTDAPAPAEARERSRDGRRPRGGRGGQGRDDRSNGNGNGNGNRTTTKEHKVEHQSEPVDPAAVGDAAAAFMKGLTDAFGAEAEIEVVSDGTELEVRANGADLGLLIGPGGRTLTAVQDLARVAAQRRLGDHDTRLKIDVAGYREKRRAALEKFARTVAADVIESGQAKALEPMSSADRKVVHDTITEVEGVTSHSDGDDPARRVVISPA